MSIVGGGIAGLTLAAALDPERFEVTLYEARLERAGFGGALTIWPDAQRALRRVGAWDLALGTGARADSARTESARNQPHEERAPHEQSTRHLPMALRDLRSGRPITAARPAPFAIVPRPRLLAALRERVPQTVRFVEQEVTDPSGLSADLVIGADGVRSNVRALVHPASAERRATPWVALRGGRSSDGNSQLSPDAYGEYWGRAGLFGIVPVPGWGTYWFTSHRSTLGPEPLDVTEVLDEAREVFARSAPVVQETLADAGHDTSETTATRLWVTRALPRYVSGRYIVIGDAAHGMTPNLGHGACDAIVDAVTLAEAFARDHTDGHNSEPNHKPNHEPHDDRLLRWQATRVPATQLTKAMSGTVMRLALSGVSAPLAELRSRVSRAARPSSSR